MGKTAKHSHAQKNIARLGSSFARIKKLYDAGKITFEEVAALTEIPVRDLRAALTLKDAAKTVLVTGGAGFIGSNFIYHLLEKYPDYRVINFDKLTYAGNLDNLRYIKNDPRYAFMQGDIADAKVVDAIFRSHAIDFVVNFAAETHVERSILSAREFVMTNVIGVQTLLDAVKKYGTERMVQISTDETYGTLGLGEDRSFSESDPFLPNVPYSAAKAGGDLMCRAYFETHRTPVMVTHCTNNYGPYQYPEKVIPLFTLRAVKNESLTLHGKGQHVRDWIFVRDHCAAVDAVLHYGVPGETYNIGSGTELPTIEIAHKILKLLGKPKKLIHYIPDRPGNDVRYALNTEKIKKNLGWRPEYSFDAYLENTLQWYLTNTAWMEKVKSRMDAFGSVLNI